jgi:glycosyltransferase involved in cell wall biosynthesis
VFRRRVHARAIQVTVSIVIPCFNHARYLRDAIDSCLEQAWPGLEVIVVDDGSTDDSAAVARRYPSVTLVQQSNRGLAAARNAGLAACRGAIVVFLDADDRLLPGAVAAAVRAFDGRPDAAVVIGRCRLVDADGHPLPTNLPCVRERYYEELLRHNFIWMPGMAAFRRGIFDSVGTFDSRVNASADYDMYLRIARRAAIATHDAVVADYRQHGANMSSDPLLMLESTLAVLRDQQPFTRAHPALGEAYRAGDAQWRAFYGEHMVERFRTAIHAGRVVSALAGAWHLLRLYPAGVKNHLAKKLLLMITPVVQRATRKWRRLSDALPTLPAGGA